MTEGNSKCRLCESQSRPLFSIPVIHYPSVTFFQCLKCDLVQSQTPTWLEHAYSDSVSAMDIGAMERNLNCVGFTLFLIRLLSKKQVSTCLDYGGGPGTFTRLLRDRGVATFRYDRFATNIYALGFEGAPKQAYDLVTLFDVFEHLNDVESELHLIFDPCHKFILAKTLLHWGIQKNWWYLSPETGQHIAFYSEKTMEVIAQKFGYQAVTSHEFTLFIRNDISLSSTKKKILRYCLYRPRFFSLAGWVMAKLFPYPSLGEHDLLHIRTQSQAVAFADPIGVVE